MLYAAIILALALARFSEFAGPGDAAHVAIPGAWFAPILICLGACLMVLAVAWHAGRAIDRTGRVRWVARVARIRGVAVLLTLVGLAYGVLAGGFDSTVRSALGDLILLDDLLIASPVLVVIVFGWWTAYPIERRLREAILLRTLSTGGPVHAPPTRAQFVLSNVRHGLLLILIPISLVIAWTDVVQRLPRWTLGTSAHGFFEQWEGWLHWVGILATLVIGPAILRAIWDVHPIADGALRSSIRAACSDARVRVRGPLVWRTGGTVVNGAILGILWPFRYLLLTDAMLERLTPAQLEAVLAHEIAHVHHRHMLWLGIAAGGAILMLSWGVEFAASFFHLKEESSAVLLGATLAIMVGGLLVFGVVSRRFEWQADAFSVRWLSRQHSTSEVTPQAAETVAATLGAVAEHNGVDATAFSWRHGSIATRQRKVLELVGRPLDQLPVDRHAFLIRVAGSILLVLGLLQLWVHAS